MAVGRISGPLLKENLIRNGIDLAFETDLLYLDVNNQRIGIKTVSPQHELDVNGTTRTNFLEVTNQATIGDINIQQDTISTDQPFLNLSTLDSVVSLNRLDIDSISIEGNLIQTNNSNSDLEFRPNGTGSVDVYSDLNIDGNLFVSGNITAEGDITIGDEDTDNVTFNAEVASDIIPDETDTYNLGSDPTTGGKEWADIYTRNLVASSINSNTLDVDGIDLTLRQGNIYYVAENGDDSHSGDHPQDPFASVKQALSVAENGDTVYLFPASYEEEFPLEIPAGVTVKGHSLRGVSVSPTAATNSQDAFLLNGEVTIEDLTVKDFFYDSVNNTGHAFVYANNFEVVSRSPYIKNVSVITTGSVTSPTDPRGFDTGDAGRGVFLDGAIATEQSKEASGLFHSCTFITPGVDAVTLTNGVRVEWLSSFTYFARRSVYAVDGSSGLKGSGQTKLRVRQLDGTISVGETVEYYDIDGTTLLASGVISDLDDDNKFYIDGKATDFETAEDRGGKTITANGNAQLDTSIKQFGSASMLLDGDGDYASISTQADFGFGTADFTVEGWVYPTDSTGIQIIFDFRTQGTDNALTVLVDGLTPRAFVNGTNEISGNVNLTQSQWNHIAYARLGTTGTLYLNGNSVGSWTDTTDYGTSKPLHIGARFDGIQQFFQGNIDDVRVVNGTAEYTNNFSLPTQRALVTEDTVLMARFDGEDGTTEFEDDALIAQDIRFSGGATATAFTLVDFTDFGAEVRMISSASVYGDFGIVGEGPGVIIYAIGQNVSYIGSGKESDNDTEQVIQANEFVELDSAKVRYSSVDERGDFRVGDLFFIDQETGNVSFSSVNFSIQTENGLSITNNGNQTIIDASKIETGNIRISENTVESLSGDINFAAFSDEINLQNNVNITGNLDVTGDVSIGGNITIGDSSSDTIQFVAGIDSDIIPAIDLEYNLGSDSERWATVYANKFELDNILIQDNFITTTQSNSDLELRTNGTGRITLQEFEVENNVISSVQDFVIRPGSELTVIDSTGSLRLPVGSTSDRPSEQMGQLRFNSSLNRFEGYDGEFWIKLNGVQDIDGDTSVTAELAPGANDNIIRFTVAGSTVASVDFEGLNSDKAIIDDIQLDGNVISTVTSNTDLELDAQGSGRIVVDDLAIKGNTIFNTQSDGITVFENVNNGYVKFQGTSGLVIPTGTSGERPPSDFSELGMTRFNVDDNRVEIYDGSDWISVAGEAGGISRSDAEDLAFEVVIGFG